MFAFSSTTLTINQPKTNVWLTLTNASGLDTICLATTTPENPFTTCLVGLPTDTWPIKEKTISVLKGKSAGSMWDWDHNPVDTWNYWAGEHSQTSLEPQEMISLAQ